MTPPWTTRRRRQHVSDEVRHMQSGNIRSYAGWIAAGSAVVIAFMIWMWRERDEYGESRAPSSFAGHFHSAGGCVVAVMFPATGPRHPVFALVISLLTFVLSLHLPVYFHRGQSGFQFELDKLGFRLPISTTTWESTEFLCGWWC